MKPWLWLALLIALVFGIGWQSSRVAARDVSAPTPSRDGGPRFDHRGGHGGPFFGSSRDFATDLGLDEAQKEKLAKVLDDSANQIRTHETAIRELRSKAREDVLAILTDDQRRKMDELTEQAFERYMKERVASGVAWFEKNAALDAAGLAKVEAILSEYESAKREFMRLSCDKDKPKAVSDTAAVKERDADGRDPTSELRSKRDLRLLEIVDTATIERFRAERTSRRRGRD